MANTTNWLSISSMSGSSGQTVLTLSAAKNLEGKVKTAEITAYNPVYNISAKTYVSIEQYSPNISVSPLIIGVPGSGGTYSLNISANCSYTIAFPEIVSYYSTSAGTGNTTITFTVPSTTASTTLVGNIVVTDESGQFSTTARIEQYGDGVHITVDPSSIVIPSSGGSVTFTVSADCIYQVSTASGFFTVSPGSGYTGSTTFTVTANGENTGNTDYSGAITITAPGYQTTVSVVQKKPERRLIVGYQVGSTTTGTPIMVLNSDTGYTAFYKIEYPDGTEISLSGTTGYTFPSTGIQYVYYTLTGDTIPDNLFKDCQRIRELQIPAQVTGVGAYAFSGHSLNEIILPPYLQTIGTYAFTAFLSRTTSTAVTIPDSVTSIGDAAFRFNGNLSKIYVSRPTPATIGSNVFSARDYEIIVPCQYMEAYLSAWSAYSEHITCQDDTTLYFSTDTSNVAGTGETRTITILNGNINPSTIGLNFSAGSYVVSGNTVYISYPQNTGSTSRSWAVTITAQTMDGVTLSNSYNITQNGYMPYSIPYTADTSTVSKTGETRTITIDTSSLVTSSITIGAEGMTGITYSYNNGVVTLIFPANTEGGKSVKVSISAKTTGGEDAFANIVYPVESGIDTRLVVFYNVTSTTQNTKILTTSASGWGSGTGKFVKAELEDGTVITPANYTGFTFPTTGIIPVYYTLRDNQLTVTNAFYGLDAIKKVIFPREFMTTAPPSENYSYGQHMFQNCRNLEEVIFNEGATWLPAGCFAECTSLKGVVLPNSLQKIWSEAFSGSAIEGCFIGNNCEYIGTNAFLGCSHLKEIIIPNSVTYMGNSVFASTTNLSSATLSTGVTSLPNSTFYNSGLLSIDLPAGLEYIGDNCFARCRNIADITIPVSVTGFGDYMLCGNTSLTSITIENPTPPSMRSGGSLDDPQKSFPIFVPCLGLNDYKENWDYTDYKDRITCDGTFNIVYDLKDKSYIPFTGETRTVDIYTKLFDVATYGFSISGESGATYTFSPSQLWEDYYVLYVTFPAKTGNTFKTYDLTITATSIYGTTASTTISFIQYPLVKVGVVYDTTKYDWRLPSYPAGTQLFYLSGPVDNYTPVCDWVYEAELQDGTVIDYTTGFYDFKEHFGTDGCYTVYYTVSPRYNWYGEKLPFISDSAFYDCDAVVEAHMDEGLTSKGTYAADNMMFNTFSKSSLSAVTIPSTLTNITHTFNLCPLSSVTIPEGLKTMVLTFENTVLTSVTIPSSIETLILAFDGCTNLSDITCLGTTPPVDYYKPDSYESGRGCFGAISSTGVLHYPAGSDYSDLLTELGPGWTGQTFIP